LDKVFEWAAQIVSGLPVNGKSVLSYQSPLFFL